MSRSCTAMSRKMPPPPFTYSNGGGDGSREHSLIVIGVPTVFFTIASFTRAKLGSKRRCSAVMSLTPAVFIALIASIVSGRSVAIGFSQNTCLPAAAHALIWSAWYCDGEQIHTASTSGELITSMSESVNLGTLNSAAAFCAFATVGFEMMFTFASEHRASAFRCTSPMRPHCCARATGRGESEREGKRGTRGRLSARGVGRAAGRRALAHDADVDGRRHLRRRAQSGDARAPRESARVRCAERRGAGDEREQGDSAHNHRRSARPQGRKDISEGVQADSGAYTLSDSGAPLACPLPSLRARARCHADHRAQAAGPRVPEGGGPAQQPEAQPDAAQARGLQRPVAGRAREPRRPRRAARPRARRDDQRRQGPFGTTPLHRSAAAGARRRW